MNRVIVTIHGTGRTAHDFWMPQAQAIALHLGAMPPHHPVWWGDVIDAGARLGVIGNWLVERLHAFALKLLGRPSKHVAVAAARVTDTLHRFVNGVAGVVAYFVPHQKQTLLRARLSETLAELTRRGHEIVLVSESLGCLIAFDVLRADAHRYNIAAWVTLGCPLDLLVRTKQRTADLGAINRDTVKQWFNLYAPRDPIAAPIALVFPAYPIRDEQLEGARGRLESHRYWSNPRVAAIIARVLRQ